MNKNILMVIDSLGMGGAEKVVLTLAQGMIELNCSVDIVIIDSRIEFDIPEGVNVHDLNFKKGFLDYFRYERYLHTLVNTISKNYENGFDGIFVHLQKSTRLMRNFKHSNIFFCMHSTKSMSSLVGKSGLRLLLKKMRLQKIYNNLNMITVSEGIKDDLIEVVGVKPASIRTIYNPVNIKEIQLLSSQRVENLPQDDYIIHVGRLVASKRHDRLLDAYQISNINEKLLIVGEGNMRSSIEENIKEKNLENQVIMYGFSPNPYPLIAGAKLLILTSDYEGFGNVLVEALSLGIPAVSTNCPSGPKEILRDELQNNLINIDDVFGLSESIKNNLISSPEAKIIYKSNTEKFDVKLISKEYLTLLDQALNTT